LIRIQRFNLGNWNIFSVFSYEKAFILKLSDAEAEAAETQVWLDFSLECNYILIKEYEELYSIYNGILGMMANMALHPEHWSFSR
jgi:four helix bundle protein